MTNDNTLKYEEERTKFSYPIFCHIFRIRRKTNDVSSSTDYFDYKKKRKKAKEAHRDVEVLVDAGRSRKRGKG